jgi:lipoate-protein ligase A
VLCAGRKIAGAAQRRSRAGLLIQGSVQVEGMVLERGRFDRALRQAGEQQWGGAWEQAETPDSVLQLARAFVETKYGCPAFNRAR